MSTPTTAIAYPADPSWIGFDPARPYAAWLEYPDGDVEGQLFATLDDAKRFINRRRNNS